MRHFLIFTYLLIAIQVSWAADKPRLEPISQRINNENILIDTRRPIAGNGDTASSLYLVQNLIRRGFKGKVDILVDERSTRIIQALSINLPGFKKRVNLINEDQLSEKVYSFVIRSGLPSGRVFLDRIHITGDQEKPVSGLVNVDSKTIFLSLTIYGNTKNKASVQPLSLAKLGEKFFLIPATGLDIQRSQNNQFDPSSTNSSLNFLESGIFRDPFSLSIRNWSIETAEKFLLKQSAQLNPDLERLMRVVINNRKEQNIKYSLAYGFSIPQVQNQARDYFKSLLASSTPTIVLTPSAFGEKLLKSFSEAEQSQIRLTSLKDFVNSGQQLQTGHLTVVQIPNVPHQIFSTLLLASNRNRIVPLGAGDGFFTTALSLGIPFAPTIVEWNIRNVRGLARILQLEALRTGMNFNSMQNLRRVFSPIASDPIELAYSQQLIQFENLFKSTISQIPDLMETINQTFSFLRLEENSTKGLREIEYAEHLLIRPNTTNANPVNTTQTSNPYGDLIQCKNLFLIH